MKEVLFQSGLKESRLEKELNVINKILDEAAIISITDHRGIIVEVNKNLEAISGYTAEELIGQTHKKIKSDLHTSDFYKIMWRTIASGKVWRGEICNKNKNGEAYWVDSTIIPIMNETGKITHYYSFRYDITSKKETEKALLKEKIKFSSIFEQSSDSILIYSLKNGLVDCNQATLKMFGYDDKKNLLKTFPWQMSPIKQRDGQLSKDFILSAVRNVLGNKSVNFELVNYKKNGEEVFTEISLSVMDYEDEILIQAIVRDITEKKKSEVKLLMAEKMASLGEMAGGIAHEINNPLAVLSSSAELLIDDLNERLVEKDELIERIQGIQKFTDRIAEIIKGLKIISRNSERDQPQAVSVWGLLETTKTLSSQKFKNGKVKLEIVKPDTDFSVHCKETQLAQVLINLLNNAYDSVSEMSHPWVNLTCHADEKNNLFTMKVVDSGNPIPKDIADKLMEPFFTTKEMGKGTGLGLSLSKKIVETYQGRIYLDQSSGHPAFIVEIPLKPAL